MITQPYRQLVLGWEVMKEVSPATTMDGVNAVQLTVTMLAMTGAGSAEMWVEESNDAQNWTRHGSKFTLTGPGFYVMPANTGICTRYVRVACAMLDDEIELLAVTQSTMYL